MTTPQTSPSPTAAAPKKSGRRVLWFHPCPEHYLNCMLDELESSSDLSYVVAFAHGGAGTYKELPVPQKAQSLFLRMHQPKTLEQLGPFDRFRKIHIDWRAELAPLHYDAAIIAGYGRRTERELIRDCHRRGIPVAMFSDSNLRSQRGRGCKARLRRSLKRRMLAPLIRDVDVLLTANSLGIAYWRYFGAPREKIMLCPYYADYGRVDLARRTDRTTVLAAHNLSPEDKLIVTAARLVPVKRIDLMIRAFRESKLADRGYKYIIAGRGPLESELKALAGDALDQSIRFIGFQQPSALLALIHHARFFAFPSTYEPHGIVVHESLAAETPVLSSNAAGAAFDLVIPGQSGWLFRSGDQADLLRVLRAATSTDDVALALRPTARATFEEWFARTNPVMVIDRLMHQLLPKTPAGATSS